MPAWRAASIRLVPGATSIALPSMVSLGTAAAPDQRLELVAELLDVADIGPHRPVIERADGRPGAALGHVQDRVQVLLAPLAVHDPARHLINPSGGLAARRALA